MRRCWTWTKESVLESHRPRESLELSIVRIGDLKRAEIRDETATRLKSSLPIIGALIPDSAQSIYCSREGRWTTAGDATGRLPQRTGTCDGSDSRFVLDSELGRFQYPIRMTDRSNALEHGPWLFRTLSIVTKARHQSQPFSNCNGILNRCEKGTCVRQTTAIRDSFSTRNSGSFPDTSIRTIDRSSAS